MLDTKEAILGLKDIQEPVELFVPEWGDTVYLRYPSANDRDAWEMYVQGHNKTPKSIWRAKLASLFLCDASGKLLFKESEMIALGQHSAAALQRIWDRAISMMSVTEEEIAELEGKSDADLLDSSY